MQVRLRKDQALDEMLVYTEIFVFRLLRPLPSHPVVADCYADPTSKLGLLRRPRSCLMIHTAGNPEQGRDQRIVEEFFGKVGRNLAVASTWSIRAAR